MNKYNFIIDSASWAEYGIAYLLLKNKKAFITSIGFRNDKNTIVINKNKSFAELNLDQSWEIFKKEPLLKKDQQMIKRLTKDLTKESFYKKESYHIWQEKNILDSNKLKKKYLRSNDFFTPSFSFFVFHPKRINDRFTQST